MKIITICGSLKFKNEIIKVAMKMELEGNVVLTPIFHINDNKEDYKEKIKLSDAILVVNINGYIGNSTKNEIEYAKSLNKEIIYLENV